MHAQCCYTGGVAAAYSMAYYGRKRYGRRNNSYKRKGVRSTYIKRRSTYRKRATRPYRRRFTKRRFIGRRKYVAKRKFGAPGTYILKMHKMKTEYAEYSYSTASIEPPNDNVGKDLFIPTAEEAITEWGIWNEYQVKMLKKVTWKMSNFRVVQKNEYFDTDGADRSGSIEIVKNNTPIIYYYHKRWAQNVA